MPDLLIVVFCVAGYLCGSIPFGLIIARFGGAGDIRSVGSGNIGATNVLRTGRKGLAIATLLADAFKGFVPTIIALSFGIEFAIFTALGAFLGHLFPIWLKFKGGKGVATYIGLILAFSWKVFLGFAVVWITVAFITRYSSLAALIATLVVPALFLFVHQNELAILFGVLSILAWVRHRQNIGRLFRGEEGKIGAKG